MKRIVSLLLIFYILLSGCGKQSESLYNKPSYFYYPMVEITMSDPNGVIAYEIREGADFASEQALLEAYLLGPKDNSMYSPFPVGTQIVDCVILDNRISVTFSNEFDQLTGVSFTLATSCIAMTLLSSLPLSEVDISILSENETVERRITLTKDQILLSDTYMAPPAG